MSRLPSKKLVNQFRCFTGLWFCPVRSGPTLLAEGSETLVLALDDASLESPRLMFVVPACGEEDDPPPDVGREPPELLPEELPELELDERLLPELLLLELLELLLEVLLELDEWVSELLLGLEYPPELELLLEGADPPPPPRWPKRTRGTHKASRTASIARRITHLR